MFLHKIDREQQRYFSNRWFFVVFFSLDAKSRILSHKRGREQQNIVTIIITENYIFMKKAKVLLTFTINYFLSSRDDKWKR